VTPLSQEQREALGRLLDEARKGPERPSRTAHERYNKLRDLIDQKAGKVLPALLASAERLEKVEEQLRRAEYAIGNYLKPDKWRDEECFKVWAEQWLPEARAALNGETGE